MIPWNDLTLRLFLAGCRFPRKHFPRICTSEHARRYSQLSHKRPPLVHDKVVWFTGGGRLREK